MIYMLVALAVVFVLAIIFVMTVVSAYGEVKRLDRAEFFVCQKHGPVPRNGGVVHLTSEQSGLGLELDQCRLCFYEKFGSIDAVPEWANMISKTLFNKPLK